MKRSAKIAIPLLLVVVMLISALGVFIFTANAVDAQEATLSEYTVTYEGGVEKSGTLVNSESGSLATLAAKLASLSPSSPTRYILTLNKDVTVSSAFTVSGNANAEVWIDFAAHTVTSTVNGAMINATGSGMTLRVFGEFAADGSYGKFTTSTSSGAMLSVSGGAYADVNYVDATFGGNAAGTAMFKADGAKLTVEHSNVTYTAAKLASMIDVKSSTVNVKYVNAQIQNAILVTASSSKVYIEGGDMLGDTLVSTDATKSSVVVQGNACEVFTGFSIGSKETTVDVIGSKMEIYTDIAVGEASAANVVFWYGDGEMYIMGPDPSAFGVGSPDYVFTANDSGLIYTMGINAGDNVVLATAASVGSRPVAQYFANLADALTTELGGFGVDMSAATESTVRVITLLADCNQAYVSSSLAAIKGCENASLVLDLNGHKLTMASTKANTIATVANQMHALVDGLDVNGNRGSFVGAGRYQRLISTQQGSSDGQISKHLVLQFRSLDMTLTGLYHQNAASTGALEVTGGNMMISDVTVIYENAANITADTLTGTNASDLATIVAIGHTSYATGVTFIDNLNVVNKGDNGMKITAVLMRDVAHRVFANGLKTDGVETVFSYANQNSVVYLNASTLEANGVAFSGTGAVSVYDTAITIPAGAISAGGTSPAFYRGENNLNVIYTGDSTLSGSFTAEDGYTLKAITAGTYKLSSSSNTHSITMPVIFSNGMMLQRNKPVNIYGYCEDVGDEIKVTIGDKTATATVGSDGKWKATFDPMEAAFNQTITVKQLGKGDESVPDKRFTNVNIGEIWIMSGQSNASLAVGHMEDLKEYQTLVDTLDIRSFTSSGYSLLPDKMGNGSWQEVTSSILAQTATTKNCISAALYPAVVKLAVELGPEVPVGAITIAQGSTKIMTWMDYEQLTLRNPNFADLYDGWVAQGKLPDKAHGANAVGTVLYNRHVYPLEGFTAAGVMWYQGCGDLTTQYLGTTSTYADYFESLELIYRRAFGNNTTDLPFYVMQLAPYSRSDTADYNRVDTFKFNQYNFCSELENTHLVSLGVDGMAFTSQDTAGGAWIHPARKSPVGIRTADMILANHYNIKVADVYTYPKPLSAVRNDDGSVTITFDTELQVFYGDEVIGFQLTANGSTWKDAKGVINGNKLTLTADGITKATGVRYGTGRIRVELKDGTVIQVSGANYTLAGSVYTIPDAATGKEYKINLDSTDAIRTMTNGNLTNASGIPMPLFKMDVTEG